MAWVSAGPTLAVVTFCMMTSVTLLERSASSRAPCGSGGAVTRVLLTTWLPTLLNKLMMLLRDS